MRQTAPVQPKWATKECRVLEKATETAAAGNPDRRENPGFPFAKGDQPDRFKHGFNENEKECRP
jgi:hypothetical protein